MGDTGEPGNAKSAMAFALATVRPDSVVCTCPSRHDVLNDECPREVANKLAWKVFQEQMGKK